jgi:hypothetical protein
VNYCTNIPWSQLETERRYGDLQVVHMEEWRVHLKELRRLSTMELETGQVFKISISCGFYLFRILELFTTSISCS